MVQIPDLHFTATFKAAEIWVSTCISSGHGPQLKKGGLPAQWIGCEVLPQAVEFKCPRKVNDKRLAWQQEARTSAYLCLWLQCTKKININLNLQDKSMILRINIKKLAKPEEPTFSSLLLFLLSTSSPETGCIKMEKEINYLIYLVKCFRFSQFYLIILWEPLPRCQNKVYRSDSLHILKLVLCPNTFKHDQLTILYEFVHIFGECERTVLYWCFNTLLLNKLILVLVPLECQMSPTQTPAS